jgi:hypothetical protein
MYRCLSTCGACLADGTVCLVGREVQKITKMYAFVKVHRLLKQNLCSLYLSHYTNVYNYIVCVCVIYIYIYIYI